MTNEDSAAVPDEFDNALSSIIGAEEVSNIRNWGLAKTYTIKPTTNTLKI